MICPTFASIEQLRQCLVTLLYYWLVVEHTPLKNMTSSDGMMTFRIDGKIKFMFQTTNQVLSGSNVTYHDTQISHAHLQLTSVIYNNHQISTFHWPSPCWSIFYHPKKSHRSATAVNTKKNMWSLVSKRALVVSAQSQARMSRPGPTKLAP